MRKVEHVAIYRKLQDETMLNLSALDEPDRQVQLHEAWVNRETLWDFCNSHRAQGLPLSVKSCRGKLVLSRFPNQGPLHDFVCRHYGLAASDLRERGWAKGVVVRTVGGSLLIRPAFSVFNVTDVAAPGDVRTWGSGERVRNQQPSQSATLGGLTCLMIELARLDIYVPGHIVTSSNYWRRMRDAATRIRLRGMPKLKPMPELQADWGLADHILLPVGEDGNWSTNNFQSLEKSGRFRVICFAQVSSEHFPGPGVDSVNLVDVFDVPVVLKATTVDRAKRRFSYFDAALRDKQRVLVAGICTVRKNSGKVTVAEIDELFALSLTPGGAPTFSGMEVKAFTGLEDRGRAYRVSVVYDGQRYLGMRPDAEILDLDWVHLFEVFGFNSPEYRRKMLEKLAALELEFPGRYTYWDVLMEDLANALDRLPAATRVVELEQWL